MSFLRYMFRSNQISAITYHCLVGSSRMMLHHAASASVKWNGVHLLALLGAHHILHINRIRVKGYFNPLNAELNPICHLLALLGAHHILHVSRIRVK